MSDLAQFEQELLRRNAALEERAAASIARAKAVVEGQVASASGVAALVAKSELAFAAHWRATNVTVASTFSSGSEYTLEVTNQWSYASQASVTC